MYRPPAPNGQHNYILNLQATHTLPPQTNKVNFTIMKRFSLITLFFLTLTLSASAFQDPKYSNLEFTVLDEGAKTVSVKAKSIAYYTKDSILNIPDSVTNSGDTYAVTTIAADGFKAINIKQIILPTTIKTIESQAFRNITTPFTIELNEGLQEIGNRAFCQSMGMKGNLVLPASLQTIYGRAALLNISVDTIVCLSTTPPAFTSSENYALPKVPLRVPCGTLMAYANHEYWSVLNIIDPCNEYLVDGLYYIPNGNTTASLIRYDKTQKLPSNLTIPTTVKLGTNMYNVSKIGSNSFEENTDLESIVLPAYLVTIGKNAFNKCTNLKKVVFNEGLETINDSCFTSTIIDTLRTPTTLISIGTASFRTNRAMKKIILNEGLQIIGTRAFTNNSNIADSIIIPSTVTQIGPAVFTGCSKIKSVILKGTTPPKVDYDNRYPVFGDASKYIIPCGSMEAYQTTEYWKDLSKQLVTDCKPQLKMSIGEALTKDTVVSSIAFSRTFPMNLWQELYLPFDVDSVLVLDEGVYYDINVPFDSTKNAGYFYLYGLKNVDMVAGSITFQEVHTLEGFTPYLILFINKNSHYFEGKEIVFKTKLGEYTLTDNYSAPNLTSLYQLHGNASLWEHSLADGFTLSSSFENGEYKFHFDYNENALIHPFSWVVTPTKDIASKIMPAPRFLAGRWGNQSSGGEVTTSMQNTSNNSLTYTQSSSLLTLHTQGQPCKVYAVDGTLLLSTDAAQDEVTIELNKGLYIVYSNGTSHKILF